MSPETERRIELIKRFYAAGETCSPRVTLYQDKEEALAAVSASPDQSD